MSGGNPYHKGKGPGGGEFTSGGGSGGAATATATESRPTGRNLGSAPDKEVQAHHKTMSEPWRKGLSEDHQFYLRRYTGQDYAIINADLRGPKHDEAAKGKDIKTLDEALGKASLPEATTVYRGVSDLAKLGIDPEKGIGTIIKDKAYMSTSLSSKRAEKYAGPAGGILKINAPKGAKGASVGGITRWPKEAEVLFSRNSGVKVTNITKQKSGQYLIEADLVQ